MNFFEAIEHIEKRPAMYFTDPISLALLDAFVLGFMTSSEENELTGINGFEFEYFNSWLTGAIPITLPENRGWRKRIEHVSKNDTEGVKKFFDLIKKFSNGNITIENQKTEPKTLKWSRGTGKMKIDEFQQIEETIVRFELITHEYSKTKFRIGYNKNDFRVYVKPYIGDKSLHTLRFTEIEENY